MSSSIGYSNSLAAASLAYLINPSCQIIIPISEFSAIFLNFSSDSFNFCSASLRWVMSVTKATAPIMFPVSSMIGDVSRLVKILDLSFWRNSNSCRSCIPFFLRSSWYSAFFLPSSSMK